MQRMRKGAPVFYRNSETEYLVGIVVDIEFAEKEKEKPAVTLIVFNAALHNPVYSIRRVPFGDKVGQYGFEDPTDADDDLEDFDIAGMVDPPVNDNVPESVIAPAPVEQVSESAPAVASEASVEDAEASDKKKKNAK